MTLTIPYRLPSAANLREHWAAKAKRVQEQRRVVTMFLGKYPRPDLPVTVKLTRIAPRALDGDNLQGAFKAVRDAVATWIGVPDNHPGVAWEYAQAKGKAKQYGIVIDVHPMTKEQP